MKKSTKSEKPAAPQVKVVKSKAVESSPVKKTVAPKKVSTPRKTAKAAAVAATVEAPSLAPAAVVELPVAEVPGTTTIVARVDVGFGNQLYLRGEGPGLSWDRGVLMDCTSNDRWSYTISSATQPIVFKVLLNDQVWSSGDDYTVAPGETAAFTPSF